jgi:hypothetical protein
MTENQQNMNRHEMQATPARQRQAELFAQQIGFGTTPEEAAKYLPDMTAAKPEDIVEAIAHVAYERVLVDPDIDLYDVWKKFPGIRERMGELQQENEEQQEALWPDDIHEVTFQKSKKSDDPVTFTNFKVTFLTRDKSKLYDPHIPQSQRRLPLKDDTERWGIRLTSNNDWEKVNYAQLARSPEQIAQREAVARVRKTMEDVTLRERREEKERKRKEQKEIEEHQQEARRQRLEKEFPGMLQKELGRIQYLMSQPVEIISYEPLENFYSDKNVYGAYAQVNIGGVKTKVSFNVRFDADGKAQVAPIDFYRSDTVCDKIREASWDLGKDDKEFAANYQDLNVKITEALSEDPAIHGDISRVEAEKIKIAEFHKKYGEHIDYERAFRWQKKALLSQPLFSIEQAQARFSRNDFGSKKTKFEEFTQDDPPDNDEYYSIYKAAWQKVHDNPDDFIAWQVLAWCRSTNHVSRKYTTKVAHHGYWKMGELINANTVYGYSDEIRYAEDINFAIPDTLDEPIEGLDPEIFERYKKEKERYETQHERLLKEEVEQKQHEEVQRVAEELAGLAEEKKGVEEERQTVQQEQSVDNPQNQEEASAQIDEDTSMAEALRKAGLIE